MSPVTLTTPAARSMYLGYSHSRVISTMAGFSTTSIFRPRRAASPPTRSNSIGARTPRNA